MRGATKSNHKNQATAQLFEMLLGIYKIFCLRFHILKKRWGSLLEPQRFFLFLFGIIEPD